MSKAFEKIAAGLREAIGLVRTCNSVGHNWVEGKGPEFGHRNCLRCGKHEMLREKRYPEIGEAKYFWE